DLVLDELESGQPHGIERLVIGTAGIAGSDGAGAQVMEGLQPLGKDGAAGFVALQVDAPDAAGAVVDVEIAGKILMGGEQLHGSGVAKGLLYVAAAAEQAFLFAAPERDADGTPWMDIQRLEDADRFHHDGA